MEKEESSEALPEEQPKRQKDNENANKEEMNFFIFTSHEQHVDIRIRAGLAHCSLDFG